MDEEIWKYPLAKRNIKKAIEKAVERGNMDFEYVIDRIGYHLATNSKAIDKLDYINEAIDTIKAQKLPMSITIKIFGNVVLLIAFEEIISKQKINEKK